jgi:hypothetical protein
VKLNHNGAIDSRELIYLYKFIINIIIII